MTCRDFGSISFSDEVKSGSPEQLLLAFKSAKTTYARIFECLTRLVALSHVNLYYLDFVTNDKDKKVDVYCLNYLIT